MIGRVPPRRRIRRPEIKGKYFMVDGKEINLLTMFDLVGTAEEIMRLYQLDPTKQESRVILSCRLRAAVLGANNKRKIAEQEYLELSKAVADIVFVASHFDPERVPLNEAERLYESALNAVRITKMSAKMEKNMSAAMEKNLENDLQEIKEAIKMKSKGKKGMKITGHFELPTGDREGSDLFDKIAMCATARLKELAEGDKISKFSKACFSLIDEIIIKLASQR